MAERLRKETMEVQAGPPHKVFSAVWQFGKTVKNKCSQNSVEDPESTLKGKKPCHHVLRPYDSVPSPYLSFLIRFSKKTKIRFLEVKSSNSQISEEGMGSQGESGHYPAVLFFYFWVWVKKNTPQNSPLRGHFSPNVIRILPFTLKEWIILLFFPFSPPQEGTFCGLVCSLLIFPLILSQNMGTISVRPRKFGYIFIPTSEIWVTFLPSAPIWVKCFTHLGKKITLLSCDHSVSCGSLLHYFASRRLWDFYDNIFKNRNRKIMSPVGKRQGALRWVQARNSGVRRCWDLRWPDEILKSKNSYVLKKK